MHEVQQGADQVTWKFQQIKPPKARGVLKSYIWAATDWAAELKYDGDRRIAQFCGARVRFTGTRESVDGSGFVEKTDNLPHLRELAGTKWEDMLGTVLDGEIVVPDDKSLKGGKSKYVTSIMGSNPAEAVRKQQANGWLAYMVFDCLWFKGQDLRKTPLRDRRERIKMALREWGNPHAHLSEQVVGANKEKYFKTCLAQGEEGVVLKHLDSLYGQENMWVKVKGEWTADVVVTGFEPGRGKYADQVGAIEFSQYYEPKSAYRVVGFCSGFDDALRLLLTKHPKRYLWRVMEIAHNGREPTGRFRHPRFKRFREDKSPKDCVYREDEI